LVRLRRLLDLTIIVACAACGRQLAPAVAPAPAPAVADLPGAEGGATRDIATHQELPPPLPDSVREKVQLTVEALELFRDSLVATAVSGASPAEAAPGPSEVSWDIDVRSFITHDKVDRYLRLFTGSARDRFTTWLQRGRGYEPMIRSTFRARGIPEDLYYLAAVESGYDPHAVSKAYAVGMWQFMTTTAKGFGLRVDWWMDERRDPIKATDAAARFLASLNEQFGSFYLAAAAYNGGPGRVKRGLARYADGMEERSGEDCFFALAETGYLRTETLNYVPQLIAAAYIGKDPLRFGITLDSVTPYAYDSLLVPAATPLAAVAQASSAPLSRIRELNPFVLRGFTPPDRPIYLRVPVGTSQLAESVLVTLPASDRIALHSQKAKKGETLSKIAGAHGISAHQLAWYNPRIKTGKRGLLSAGQVVQVPTLQVVAAAFDVPDPAIEKYGTSARRGARTHVVKRGESLSGIAQKYHTSVATIARLNHLNKQVIYPGQTIIVASGSSASRSTKPRSPSSKAPTAKKKTTTTKKATSKPSGATAAPKKKAASTGKAASSKSR